MQTVVTAKASTLGGGLALAGKPPSRKPGPFMRRPAINPRFILDFEGFDLARRGGGHRGVFTFEIPVHTRQNAAASFRDFAWWFKYGRGFRS